MFLLDEKYLNKQQIEAIVDEDSVMLIACPGSGKTRTLTYKIAYELSKLTSNKQYIIAITYTNRAADEIKERIEHLGINIKQLWIGTIHSFCLEWILRPYSQYIEDLKYGFRVIGAYDAEEIINKLSKTYNDENNLSGRDKINFYDFSFRSTREPRYYAVATSEHKKEAVEIIFTQYRELLIKNHQIDYEMILFYSVKILQEKPLVSKILSHIFSYMIVDEFQDTKDIQYGIMGLILSKNMDSKLFIVGDPNQSIFHSLGGYAISKEELESLTSLIIKKRELVDNYRSSSKIIDYFSKYKVFNSNIEASGEYRDYQSIITFNEDVSKDNLIDEIVRLIEYNINDIGIKQNEICILAPWWIHLLSLTRTLMVKLPDYSFDGPGLAPFARDIDNFWYKLSRIALTNASPRTYVRRIRWAQEIIDELNNIGMDIHIFTPKKVLRFSNSIKIDETDGIEYLKKFFGEFLRYLQINLADFSALNESYYAFFESSKKRINRLEKEGIEYAGDIETFRKVFQQRNGITVSTIHGAKGAEFDTVIAIGLLKGIVPHFSDPDQVVSAKKQLYVVSSRARKNLHLIAERRNNAYGREYDTTDILLEHNYNYDLL